MNTSAQSNDDKVMKFANEKINALSKNIEELEEKDFQIQNNISSKKEDFEE